ncbi:MAG: DsbC family protein [Burkholderiales bacterium]|nr:DsbC family protein [Burkholderiales bacterium]
MQKVKQFFPCVLSMILVAFLGVAVSVSAQSPELIDDPTGEAAKVKALLEQKMPNAPIRHVTKTSYLGGLYEVLVGNEQIIYTDAKVSYVLVGAIIDMSGTPAAMTNLTENRLRELKRVDISKIPVDYAFKRVKGDGKRVLHLFSDIDCPFCERIEETLRKIDNVTIYTYLLPLEGLHPDAARKSGLIWCAADKAKAWNEYYATKKLPDNKGDCETPIAKIQGLADSFGIHGTPGLIFADGTIVPGAIPGAKLEAELARAAEAQKEKK